MHRLSKALPHNQILGGWLQAAGQGLLAAVQGSPYTSSSSITARKVFLSESNTAIHAIMFALSLTLLTVTCSQVYVA